MASGFAYILKNNAFEVALRRIEKAKVLKLNKLFDYYGSHY